MKLLIVVDIGCIECGEDSAILKVLDASQPGAEEEAESVRKAAEEYQATNWHGQHSFETFEAEV